MSENAKRFTSFMSGFAVNLSEEEVEPDPRVQQRLPVRELSGAQGLLSHQMSKKGGNNYNSPKRQGNSSGREALDRAHAQQEDTQQKLKILMQNPQLWLQFKSRLAANNPGGGAVGVQTVLRDFLADHPEIDQQLQRERQEAAQRMKDARGMRRISILETVSNLTLDLAGEAQPRNGLMGNNSSSSHHRRYSNDQQQRRNSNGSTGSYGSYDTSHSGPTTPTSDRATFMGSATEIGFNFLKRASGVVSTSHQSSHGTLNTDSLDSSEGSGHRRVDEVSRLKDSKPKSNLAAFNEKDEDGYVTSDDEGGYYSSDDEYVNGFIDLTLKSSKREISRAA